MSEIVQNKKKSQEANINFKINQVIKSGSYKIGKLIAPLISSLTFD